MSLFGPRRHAGPAPLSAEGHLPGFDGATGWLNSAPLTTADLHGQLVLIDFWTFTCINWIRTAPYLRAWDERYREHGLTVIGVHTPEFRFETDVDSIMAAIEERRISYPVAVDSDYAIWTAFANRFWPALYIADTKGTIRFHQFGEGRYDESERVIQQLLDVPRSLEDDLVVVEANGVEAPADWAALESPETYLGYERAERFASPDGAAWQQSQTYSTPTRLRLNHWALSGDWTIGGKAARLNEAGGRLTYRFRARDVHLVMGPAERGEPVRFRVRIDGNPPGAARGIDLDDHGDGTAADRRLYQLVRQPGAVDEHTFEITFSEPGVEAYAFTFG
jgi:thiol-disulfide isomerase/thioredoxin